MHIAASSWVGFVLESVGDVGKQWHALLASKLSGDHLPVQPLLQQLILSGAYCCDY